MSAHDVVPETEDRAIVPLAVLMMKVMCSRSCHHRWNPVLQANVRQIVASVLVHCEIAADTDPNDEGEQMLVGQKDRTQPHSQLIGQQPFDRICEGSDQTGGLLV